LLILPLPTTTEPDPLSYISKYYFEITSAVGLLSFWVRELFGLLFKTIIVMSKGYTTKTVLTSYLPALHFRPLHFVNKVPLHFPFQCLFLYILPSYLFGQPCLLGQYGNNVFGEPAHVLIPSNFTPQYCKSQQIKENAKE